MPSMWHSRESTLHAKPGSFEKKKVNKKAGWSTRLRLLDASMILELCLTSTVLLCFAKPNNINPTHTHTPQSRKCYSEMQKSNSKSHILFPPWGKDVFKLG